MDLEVLQILKLRRVWLQLARLSVIPPQVRPARGGFFSQPSSQTQRPRGGGGRLSTGVTIPLLKGPRTPRWKPGQDVLNQAKS